jgi:hypothetical protein
MRTAMDSAFSCRRSATRGAKIEQYVEVAKAAVAALKL